MELISLNSFIEIASKKNKKKIAVAAAEDQPALEAVSEALKLEIVEPMLIGDEKKIREIAKLINFDLKNIEIINQNIPLQSCKIAVNLVREGKAQILMKGFVSTGEFLKAVLDKENGLRSGIMGRGTFLSHIGFFETTNYRKLIALTDAAQNIAPTLEDKINILNNAVDMFHRLGIMLPKVAILAAVENVNIKMPATVEAAIMTQMNRRNQIKGCIIDGPLAFDNAISKEAAEHKGIIGEVPGDADILLAPDIEAGNILYKCFTYIGGATVAAVILGAAAPIVLTSRADTDRSKLMSIALAATY